MDKSHPQRFFWTKTPEECETLLNDMCADDRFWEVLKTFLDSSDASGRELAEELQTLAQTLQEARSEAAGTVDDEGLHNPDEHEGGGIGV